MNRSAAVRFVFVTMVLDWLVVGIGAPVIPQLIYQFMGGKMNEASAIVGGFATAFALVLFVAAPLLGIASDRFGRRPIILLSSVTGFVEGVILMLAPNVWWLLAGRIVAGATTGGAAAAAAYIADVTPPEKRAGAFGMLSAAFGIGFTLGPAIGGILGGINARLPFAVIAALMLLNVVYGLFVLPESHPKPARTARIDWSRANPVGALKFLRRHGDVAPLAASLFFSNLAVQSFSVFVLYTIFRFGWSECSNGLALGAFGAISVISGIVVGRLVKRFGGRAVVAAAFGCGSIGFLVYGLAPAGWVFACGLPLTGIWAMAGGPTQSAMSRRVAPHAQGELQGAISSMRSISLIVGPPLFTLLFATVTRTHGNPLVGLPWFLGTVVLLVAAACGLRGMRGEPAVPAALS